VSLSSEMAHKIMEACQQRARDLRSPVSIAIVDAGGHLVLFERMMVPYGFATGNMAIAKASTAVMFNQSTDAVAQWGAEIPGFAASLASMTDGKFIMAAGGWPVRINNVTIGGVGVSGGNAPGRDDDIAQAGLAALGIRSAVRQPEPTVPQSATTVRQAQPVVAGPANTPGKTGGAYTQALYTQPQETQTPEDTAPRSGVYNTESSQYNQYNKEQ
jgi:Uncharacterized protein, possibly involved in utilization of glycolate and propanediol